ncbi:MAG: sulfatase-like hydrolase/transferase [Thermoanaerobaculales bacterium]|nr:sulfatase-like hydrolase/transferase [Thermoanaerobaculales bacterium]
MRAVIAAALLLTTLGTGCRERELPRSVAPNIVLVVLDTVAAAHIGCTGRTGGPTPRIDTFAASGVTFRHAYTTAPWTQPAVASILTGRFPSRHGVLRLFDVLPDAETTLGEVMAGAGFETAGVVSHMLLEERFGLAQGFGQWNAEAVSRHEGITSDQVTDAAVNWLRGRSEAPFLLLVHYFDPHLVYHDHEDFDLTHGYSGPLRPAMGIWDLRDARPSLSRADIGYLRSLHREEIAHVDANVGRLLDALDDLDLTPRTTVVLMADHGEEIMEHGWIGHTRTLFDELIRVPLVIRHPQGPVGLQVDDPVSVVDVFPTLVEMAGLQVPGQLDGRSLTPYLNPPFSVEGAAERQLFAEVSFTVGPNDGPKHLEKVAFKTAVIKGRYKLIHDLLSNEWRLFDQQGDPDELRALGDDDPNRVRLQAALLAWEAQRTATGSPTGASRALMGDDEEARLRALGYLW